MIHQERPPEDSLLADCPQRGVGLVLAEPISERVDRLIDCVEATGERTTRKELIASLILAAPHDGPELAAKVRRLRLARVTDAVLGSDRRVLDPAEPIRSPGPRPRRGTHAAPSEKT